MKWPDDLPRPRRSHVPPWRYASSGPYEVLALYTIDSVPIDFGREFESCDEAVDYYTQLYVPPQLGVTSAVVDGRDQIILGYAWDAEENVLCWYGSEEAFHSLYLAYGEPEVFLWEAEARQPFDEPRPT